MHYTANSNLRYLGFLLALFAIAATGFFFASTSFASAQTQSDAGVTVVAKDGKNSLYANGSQVTDLSCVENRCVGYADGKPLIVSCQSSKQCVGTLNSKEVQFSSQAVNFVAQTMVQSKQIADQCLNGKGEQCRNRCTTSYIALGDAGTPVPTDCYGQPNDPVKKALDQLAQCIGQDEVSVETVGESNGVRTLDLTSVKLGEPELKQLICIDRRPFTFSEDGEISMETQQGTTRVTIPARCQQIYEDVVAVRDGKNAQETATASDAEQCTWRGSVTCYPTTELTQVIVGGSPTTLPQIGQKYKCIPKVSKSSTGSTSGSSCGSGVSGFFCKAGSAVSGIFNGLGSSKLGQALGQIVGAISGQLVFSGGGDDDEDSSSAQCDAGYTRSVENGRVVCRKDEESSTKPQCALAANVTSASEGDTIILRWRTLNAESVDIEGVGENLSDNGDQQVTITETTEYILTAHGSNDDDTTCTTIVFVDDGAGATGNNPPRLTCEPSIVRPGETSDISWACIASADSSSGVNIDTGGSLADTISVSPDHNTEYKVSCMTEDTVIGTNSCSIMVGEPLYDITAYPAEASRGDRVRIAWSSLYMNSCRVRGPRGFDYSQAQGVVATEPFSTSKVVLPDNQIRAAIYTIECKTVFGDTVTKDVTVDFVED